MSKEFNRFFGTRQHSTNLKLTRELIVTRYRDAWLEWGSLVTRLDSMHFSGTAQERGESKAEDNLSTRLDGLHIEADGEDDHRCTHPGVNPSAVQLYHCPYCNNPSAVLRKCGGCGKTRYVDLQLYDDNFLTYGIADIAMQPVRKCTGPTIKLHARLHRPSLPRVMDQCRAPRHW